MLFGHQHNDASQSQPEPASIPAAPGLNPLAVDPTTGVSLPVAPDEPAVGEQSVLQQPAAGTVLDPGPATPPPPPPPPTSAPVVTDAEVATPQTETVPADAAQTAPQTSEVAEPQAAPAEAPQSAPQPEHEEPVMPLDMPEDTLAGSASEPMTLGQPQTYNTGTPLDAATEAPPTSDELVDLKQQALAELSPLVDQLDQTPEERFRTKMMLIQSTDNQALIKEAYEAAQQITDEKSRAQALLDIINEINYFTSLNKQG